MGLGLVELVLAVEDRFGITIPNAPLAETRTVGALVDLIVRLSSEQMDLTPSCPTSRAFFRLRGVFSSNMAINRHRFTPDLALSDIVPATYRRTFWARLRRAGIYLPRLELPWPFKWLLGSVIASCVVSMLALAYVIVRGMLSWTLALYFSIPFVALQVVSTVIAPFQNRVPAKCATLGDAATFLALDASIVGALPADDVLIELRHLIHEQLGVPLDRITVGARFIEDLGAG